MANVSVRARDIVGFARRNNIKFDRGATGQDGYACARSVLAIMAVGPRTPENPAWHRHNASEGIYSESINRAIGLTEKQLHSVEVGFEDWDLTNYPKNRIDQRYYRVGRKVAKLAGLTSD
jgi:hypothetical protein